MVGDVGHGRSFEIENLYASSVIKRFDEKKMGCRTTRGYITHEKGDEKLDIPIGYVTRAFVNQGVSSGVQSMPNLYMDTRNDSSKHQA